jgi:anti-anti-sigma factor
MQKEEHGRILIVSPEGRIDTLSSKVIQDELLSCIEQGSMQIIIDLSKIDYISSMGLRVFIVAQKLLKPKKGELVISNIKPLLRQVFDISGFTALFSFFDSREAAIVYFEEVEF